MTAYQELGDAVRRWRGDRSRTLAAEWLSMMLDYPIQWRQLERVERAELTERSMVLRVLAAHFGVKLPGVVR